MMQSEISGSHGGEYKYGCLQTTRRNPDHSHFQYGAKSQKTAIFIEIIESFN
jgi:hypothetical protein